jgi:hypothetical protein
MRQERRHFERHPAVDAIGPGKDRLEQVRDTSSSYMVLFLIALSKIVGFEVSPVTERSSM